MIWYTQHTDTPLTALFSGSTRVSEYQKGKNILDFTEARESERQWHQLGHICKSAPHSRQITMPAPQHCFLQAGCPSCSTTNGVKALYIYTQTHTHIYAYIYSDTGFGCLEYSLKPHSTQYKSFQRRSSQPITWLILINQTVQENTDKRTQYKSEKVNNLKHSKTTLPWFSCLLKHSARKRGGLILQHPRTHTRRDTGYIRHVHSHEIAVWATVWMTYTEWSCRLRARHDTSV